MVVMCSARNRRRGCSSVETSGIVALNSSPMSEAPPHVHGILTDQYVMGSSAPRETAPCVMPAAMRLLWGSALSLPRGR